jgi:triacylglycerol lipase
MRLRIVAGLSAMAIALVGLLATGPAGASSDLPVGYDFLQNAVMVNVAASAPGENIWTCKPTPEHPRPVVLVHGTGGNAATNWATYAALLKNNGYCVYALTYGVVPALQVSPVAVGGIGEMRASAQQLKDVVAKVLTSTGATQVDLVGHSQGTLMPDYYLKYLGGAGTVRHYVSLAPLWHGEGASALGDLMAMGTAYGFDVEKGLPVCRACTEMVNGSAFMKQIRQGGVAVPGVEYTNIVTRYDDVVLPYTSGIETGHPNMANIVLQDVCPIDFSDHLEIASSPNAAQIVLNALDPAHAKKVACRLTLPANGFVF